MITTPEQMREAANNDEDLIRRIDAITVAHQYTTSLDDPRMFAEMRAIPIAPQPTPIVDGSGPGPHYVADMLSQFVASVWHLLDNSETSGPIDDPITTVMQSDFDEVSKWLDRLEALPSGSTSHLSAAELVATYLAPQPVAVTVKPLVWVNVPTGYGPETYEAYSSTGFYQVFTDEDSCCGAVVAEFATNQQQFGTTAARSVARVNGFIDAKAAAQADYEARILSALTIQPADPLSDPRVVALVEAAKRALNNLENTESEFGITLESADSLRSSLRAIGGEV